MTFPEIHRRINAHFHIDTNRINARGGLGDVNQLEAWADRGVISLEMSEVAQREALAGGSESRRRKAYGHIATITYAETLEERALLRQIADVLFPNGIQSQNEANDAEIAFNARKYGAMLVTADGASKKQPGGLLGRKTALARLNVQVMTDAEAVAHVRELIESRDKAAREIASASGREPPTWVGQD